MILSPEEEIKRNEFLLEVKQDVESAIEIPRVKEETEAEMKRKEKGKGKLVEESSSEKQQLIPYIDWASLDVFKWFVEKKNDQVMAIVEEIPNIDVATITALKGDLTTDN